MTARVQIVRYLAALGIQGVYPPVLAHLLGDGSQRVGMGRALDELAVHLGDAPFGMFVDQPSSRFEDAEAAVHAALWTEAVGVAPVGQERFEVVARRGQDDADGGIMAVGTVVFFVSVETSDALEEDVDGAQVGYQQIGVNVERLFERLGSDDCEASRLSPLPSSSSTRPSSILRSQAANRP